VPIAYATSESKNAQSSRMIFWRIPDKGQYRNAFLASAYLTFVSKCKNTNKIQYNRKKVRKNNYRAVFQNPMGVRLGGCPWGDVLARCRQMLGSIVLPGCLWLDGKGCP
jgi:hypothetical protein